MPETGSRHLRHALRLEAWTMGWNVLGAIVLVPTAAAAGSVALTGFALDSVLEIGASGVVIWELAGNDDARRDRALRLIGYAFALLAAYLVTQSTIALATGHRPDASDIGLTWTGLTAAVMFALAFGKRRVGRALENPVVLAEARVTTIDALLACAVVVGLALNTAVGWWWADTAAALVVAAYAAREAGNILIAGE